MILGFAIIFFAALGGVFNAFDMTTAFLKDPEQLRTWEMTLLNSAHGHTNLFGILHILFGLTLTYSTWSPRAKFHQTWMLFCGAFAMGPLMIFRGLAGPSYSFDALGSVMGVCLSLSMTALALHILGLLSKFMRRGAFHEV
jgi:hypothetical protein